MVGFGISHYKPILGYPKINIPKVHPLLHSVRGHRLLHQNFALSSAYLRIGAFFCLNDVFLKLIFNLPILYIRFFIPSFVLPAKLVDEKSSSLDLRPAESSFHLFKKAEFK